MAKLTATLSGRIKSKAMLNGPKWQKAFFISLVINLILLGLTIYVRH